MRALGAWIGALAVASLLLGCGDDDGGSGTPDAGPTEDGSTPRDTGPRDTGPPPEDMGPRDMGPRDMGPPPPVDMGPPGEPCTMRGASEDLPCGMCGTQTRFCTSDLIWEYSDCAGEHGECMAGDTGRITCGDMMVDARCTDACSWMPMDEMVVCPLPLCTDPLTLAAREGETVSVTVDTSMGPPGPLELGSGCGGAEMLDPMLRPPQAVVAVTVPGTGARLVDFTMVNDGTDAAFDTIVQLRRGDCMALPPSGPGTMPGMPTESCFDDTNDPMTGMLEFRSSGRFAAMGGETVYLLVTGFAYGGMPPMDRTSSGVARLDVTVGGSIAAPTLTAATVQVSPDESRFALTGGDADGDASAMRVTFLNAASMPVDRDGSGMVDALDDLSRTLPSEVGGMMSFTTTVVDVGPFLAEQLTTAMATQARITLVDATGLSSAPLTVGVALVSLVGFGEACDATHVCRTGLACAMGTCQTSPEITAACAAAAPLALAGDPPTGTASGMLAAGTGLFTGTCGASDGTEALYRVTVPAGAWDLIASNHNAGTAVGTDTVLYVRRVCEDRASAGACNDDSGDSRAEVVVQDAMAGDYTIFQERFGMTGVGMTTAYQLDVRLRPVLGAGAACDPTGVANRCSTGPCPTAAMCPAAPTP